MPFDAHTISDDSSSARRGTWTVETAYAAPATRCNMVAWQPQSFSRWIYSSNHHRCRDRFELPEIRSEINWRRVEWCSVQDARSESSYYFRIRCSFAKGTENVIWSAGSGAYFPRDLLWSNENDMHRLGDTVLFHSVGWLRRNNAELHSLSNRPWESVHDEQWNADLTGN